MMELYHTYQDWEWLINFTENMLKNVSEIAEKPLPKDNKWRNIEFSKLIKEKTGLDYDKNSKEEFLNFAKKNNINTAICLSKGKITDEIFKKIIRISLFSLILKIGDVELFTLSWVTMSATLMAPALCI